MPSRLFNRFFFRLALALAALALIVGCSRPAAAGELTYEAPHECPPRDAVAARTAARAPNARDAAVTIHKTGGRFAAHMSIGGGEDTVERDVEGRSCDAVIDAFVLVLSLDRSAPQEPPPPVAIVTAAPAPSPDVAIHEEPVKRSPVEFALVQDFELRKLGWENAGGVVVAGEVAAPDLFGWRRYRPSARLGIEHLEQRLTGRFSDDGSTTFTGFTLQLCPIGVAPISTPSVDVLVSLCGVFDAGSAHLFEAQGWFDGGGLVRAAVQVGRKASVRAFFELDAGILTAFVNPSYPVVQPQTIPVSNGASVFTGGVTYPGGFGPMIALGLGGGVVFP